MTRVKNVGRQRLSFRNSQSSKSWSYRLYKDQIYRRLLAEKYIWGIFDSIEELRRAAIDMCIYTFGKSYEFSYRAIQYWLYCVPATEARAVRKLSKQEIEIIAKVCGISGKRGVELFSSIWLSPKAKYRGQGRYWICVDGPEKLKFAKMRDYIRSDLKGVKSLPEGYEAYLIDLQEVGIDEDSKKAAE